MATAHSLGASFQTSATSLQYLDRALLTILCTGSPTGTVSVQISNNYNVNNPSAADWFDMPISLNALTGSAQNYVVEISETAAPWIRISFSYTSGSGSMTAVVTAKES